MPIRPETRDRYPANWPEISTAIKERAGWRCECRGECGWTLCGTWADNGWRTRCNAAEAQKHPMTGSYVRLTTAHLDHTPQNCGPDLRAYCQGCHLNYDKDHHAETARATREAARRAAGEDPLPIEERTTP